MKLVAGIAIAFLVVMSIPLVKSVKMAHDYKTFVKEYTDTLNYARRHGGGKVEFGGKTHTLSNDKASRMYTYILDAGMGKPIKEVPDADVYTIRFPDGASLRLWETEITEKSRIKDEGVAISFTNKEGKVYQYDTDMIDNDSFLRTLAPDQ